MDDRLLLPSTSAACVFLMDPSRRNILLNQFSRPTLKVQSVLNRANDTAIIQSNGANQPIWSGNLIQGTYSWMNNPGSKSSLPCGQPGLSFLAASTQYMAYNSIASFANSEANVTAVAVVNFATGNTGTIFGFGATGSATPKLTLSVSGGTLSLVESNGSTFTASHSVTNGVHVVTAARANNNLVIRIDSAQVATATVTGAAETFNTFTVGAINSNGSVGTYLTSSLGPVAVYKGPVNGTGITNGLADVFQVETYLLQRYGVIRGASSGINAGF